MARQRMYLVEPNPVLALDLQRLLHRFPDKETLFFRTAEQGWDQIQSCPPDILLLDISTTDPRMALDWLHRIGVRFSFPILLLSSWPDIDAYPSIQLMEFTEILKKPFSDWDFVQIMDRLGFSCLPNS